MTTRKIPKNDLSTINKVTGAHQGDSINKDRVGRGLSSSTGILNRKGFEIQDFSGRTLKHAKFCIKDGLQIKVCERGDKFEDLDFDLRQNVQFSEDDFE